MKGQLLCRAAGRGNDEHIQVPIAVARKSDPLAVRRELGIRVARFVHGQALRVLPVFISRPDIAEVSEGDAAVVVAGITHEPGLARKGERGHRENEQSYDEWVESF